MILQEAAGLTRFLSETMNLAYLLHWEGQDRNRRSSWHAARRFVHAAAEETGLPSETVDLVSCCLIMHELPQAATRAIIAEAHRILRPGGTLAIMVRLLVAAHTSVGVPLQLRLGRVDKAGFPLGVHARHAPICVHECVSQLSFGHVEGSGFSLGGMHPCVQYS